MTAISYVNPKGFPEFLPPDQRAFDSLKQTVASSFSLHGFDYLETPAVEYLHTLASQGDISKEIYAITRAKNEGSTSSDRGLRFDLTTPFARYVAQHQGHLTFPFKRYQIDKVWRGERPQKGRYREIYQADIDIIAKNDLPVGYDAQILEVLATTLDTIGLFDFTIRVNNRTFLAELMQDLGIQSKDLSIAFNIVDKIAKVPKQETLKRLVDECLLTSNQAENFLAKVSQKYTLKEVAEITNTFSYLEKAMDNLSLKRGKVIVDLSIVRGLDYYTGFVFETTVDTHESYGSICSGGRYENLVSKYSKQVFPGVGGSIGLSRLFFILSQEDLIEKKHIRSGVYIMLLDESKKIDSFALAAQIRSAEVRCDSSVQAGKFGKQIQYADKKNYQYIAIVEEDNQITLKNLETKEQKSISKEAIIKYIY